MLRVLTERAYLSFPERIVRIRVGPRWARSRREAHVVQHNIPNFSLLILNSADLGRFLFSLL